MNSTEEIQCLIERLTPRERATIGSWLRTEFPGPDSSVAEPKAAYDLKRNFPHMSVEDYLDFEDAAGLRYEYVGGQIFAMTGATVRHGAIVRNLSRAFDSRLGDGPCQAFASGLKVRLKVHDDDVFYCPDIVVVCGKINMEGKYLSDPRLIVEVLSPSTELIDRREKSLHYRHIEAMEEYVLVAQRTREITVFRRAEQWHRRVFDDAEDIVALRSIELSLPVNRIYGGVFQGTHASLDVSPYR